MENAPLSSTNGHNERMPANPERRGLRVLVVEDDPDAAETMATLLKLHGHQAEIATSGPAALQAAEAYHPDVVVLDICLPGMNGYQVARELRKQGAEKRPLLLAVTGFQEEADRHFSAEAGIDLHLLKPVKFEDLQSVLSRFQTLVG